MGEFLRHSLQNLHQLMDIATQCVDYFILEVPEPALVSDLPDEDDLTRPEMEDAGFQVALVDEPGVIPNPLTNALSFQLETWDSKSHRTLFSYAFEPVRALKENMASEASPADAAAQEAAPGGESPAP